MKRTIRACFYITQALTIQEAKNLRFRSLLYFNQAPPEVKGCRTLSGITDLNTTKIKVHETHIKKKRLAPHDVQKVSDNVVEPDVTTLGREIFVLKKPMTNGKPRIWRAFVKENVGTVLWGVENMKQQQMTRTILEGKQGRTVQEQLLLELRSIANKKIQKDGYELITGELDSVAVAKQEPKTKRKKSKPKEHAGNDDANNDAGAQPRSALPIADTTIELPPLPMLARVWTDRFDVMDSERIFIQPKLDGLRCLANVETGELWSRARKKFKGLEHISESVLSLPNRNSMLAAGVRFLDGEIYTHGLDFQEITSRARRTAENPHLQSDQLQLFVFDACALTLNFEHRLKLLRSIFDSVSSTVETPTETAKVLLCPTEERARDSFDVQVENKAWTSKGFEGTMIRLSPTNPLAGYRPGVRSSCLLKYKEFQQEEFEVVEFLKHREYDTLGSVSLRLPNGQTFAATPADKAQAKLEMWEKRAEYMKPGWTATVQYQDLSRTGVPRFPILIGFRHKDDR